MQRKKSLFKLGIFIFISSFIVGYGGLGFGGVLYMKTDEKFWLWVGSGFYGLSWIMLGISLLICGKEGIKMYLDKKENAD